MGSASAADLFFAYSFVSNMGVGLIWYAALDSWRNLVADCIFKKSFCLILSFQCFCLLVNGLWLIGVAFWHQIQVSAMFWSSQKDAQRKTIQCGGGISSRSAVGTRLVTKTMPRIAIGSQGCPYWGPGVSREAVFIDCHWFSLISGGFEAIRARKLGSLWHRVIPCGSEVIPL